MLEPLSGYLWLAACLGRNEEMGNTDLCGPFNFGPALTSNKTVADLVQELLKHVEGDWNDASDPMASHEASKLNLAIDKAFHLLQWQPVWGFERTMEETAGWYSEEFEGVDIQAATKTQIELYQNSAKSMNLLWTNR